MLVKPTLFLSSYAPLFALLALRFQGWKLQAVFAALAILGMVGLYLILRVNRSVSPNLHTLVSVQDAGPEAASYLASYLLPFVTVSAPSARDLVAYAGFLLIAGIIHVRSSIIQINPVLYVIGMRILAVKDSAGFEGYLLTRGNVEQRTPVWCAPLGENVLVLRPR